MAHLEILQDRKQHPGTGGFGKAIEHVCTGEHRYLGDTGRLQQGRRYLVENFRGALQGCAVGKLYSVLEIALDLGRHTTSVYDDEPQFIKSDESTHNEVHKHTTCTRLVVT